MAHNSKRNRRDTTNQDGDDYVYPTKRVKNNTRNRNHDRNLIKAGLIDNKYGDNDTPMSDLIEGEEEWYDDTPMASDEDIAAELDMNGIDEASAYDRLHDDLMEDYGYDWEDY